MKIISRTRTIMSRAGLSVLCMLFLASSACTPETAVTTHRDSNGELSFSFTQSADELKEEWDTPLSTDDLFRFAEAATQADRNAFSEKDYSYMGRKTLFTMTLPNELDSDEAPGAYLSEHLEESAAMGMISSLH